MASSNNKHSTVMQRRATNSSGYLGSLYDGYRDRIIEKCNSDVRIKRYHVSAQAQCKLITGDDDASRNLLQWIGIQDQLRLSLLVQLTKRDGIGAVLDYPHPIDRDTRFLYYSLIRSKDRFETIPEIHEITKIWTRHHDASHIITEVQFGIDLLVVMQLPSEPDIYKRIDCILKRIQKILLEGTTHILCLHSSEYALLRYIISTQVYSNISLFTGLTKVSDILDILNVINRNSTWYSPLSYTFELIAALCPPDMMTQLKMSHPLQVRKATSFSLIYTSLHHIEQYMFDCRNVLKYGETFLEKYLSDELCPNHRHIFEEAWDQCSQIKYMYISKNKQLPRLIIYVRSGNPDISEIDQVVFNDELLLKKYIKKLNENLKILKLKHSPITNYHANERRLDTDYSSNRTLDPSDKLNKNNQSKVTYQYQRPTREEIHNSAVPLQNASAPNFSSQPKKEATTSSKQTDYDENYSQQKISSSKKSPQPSTTAFSSRPSSVDETINILLVGETGVGKSTFINAFANYLAFDVFDQAELNEPIVIIPVSFVMTVGDNFEERTVKFGEVDSRNNENFNNVGQSVTQHCKSYLFDLKDNGKRLRIIDTPGFGDTRGLEQDSQNMDHILQYVNNLTHLNAICFLLKPNSSRLNMFFRTCLTQLFSFLAPTARDNVIFCFTNARSTFYTPGDTAPLLKTMLASASIDGISLKKDNTFCFDSESFRYLVALRNDIPFNEEDKLEYEKSWLTSVKESNRLIDLINTKLTVYHMERGWQSIRHAQFEISHMIRPILETIRNTLRNRIIYQKQLSNQFIELSARSLRHASVHCRSCKPDLLQVSKFWVAPYLVHEIQTECQLCPCPANQHVPIDCVLDYKISVDASEYDPKQMIAMLNKLCDASTKLAHFLMDIAHSTKNDPFLSGLLEMIEEENNICTIQNQTDLNKLLVEDLKKTKTFYEELKKKMKLDGEHKILPVIYDLIQTIHEFSPIRKQMIAVKETQKNIMEGYEYEAQQI